MVIRVATSSPTKPSENGPAARGRVVLLVVFLTSLLLVHVTPRASRPYLFPFPDVDDRALRRASAESRALAESVAHKPLMHEVRLVGELVRRAGAHRGVEGPSFDPAEETTRLLARGLASELLRLRALQTELFLRETRRFAETLRETPDLVELGGDFADVARGSWLDERGNYVLSEDALRLFFRLRWGKLTGSLAHAALAPSLTELRAYHALLLAHPPGSSTEDPASLASVRLRTVDEIGSLDPSYPADLARGLLELEMGHPDLAEQSLLRERNSTRAAAHSWRIGLHLRESRRRQLDDF